MIQTIDISLIPSENKPVINVSQFDNISRVLRFNVFDDAEMEVPHVFDVGDTVLLNIRKNDNNIVVITGEIITETDPETQEVTEQYLTFELTEQACACVGSNYGEVSITSGDDEVIGSCNFKLIVERSPLAGGISSQTAIDNLTTQIEQITEEVIGDNYYDKQEIDNKFDNLDIPTKTSELENDSGFITASALPTKTSELENDSGFITASALPTKTSELENDSGFTTIDDAATANNKTWSSNKINNELINLLPIATATGNPANFSTSYALPLELIKAYIVATGGSGTPDTPIPIVGFDSVTITQADVNLQTVKTVVISLDQTVYGGYVTQDNAGNRTLILTYAYVSDMKSLGWYTQDSTSKIYAVVISDLLPPESYDERKTGFLCSDYPAAINAQISSSMTDKSMLRYKLGTQPIIAVRNTDCENLAAFKNSVENSSFIYELSTPVLITLADGEPVNALLGVNNISSNSGDVEITYKCSINEAINAAIASQTNRSVSLMKSSETIETIERGDNNDENKK